MSLFLGWMPDPEAQAALATLQQRIRAALPPDAPRHDWRKPAQWHMTLRYLGETIDATQRDQLEAAMVRFAAGSDPAAATLVGAQYWPHARVLVARILASESLTSLFKRLESAMRDCGFAKERTQTAHVTLAYLPRHAPMPAPLDLGEAIHVPLRIERIDLLRTVPGAYESLASWQLPSSGNAP